MLDFRGLVDSLEQSKTLRHVDGAVDPRYEIAAMLKKTKGRQPLLFTHVKGYGCKVAAGVGGTRADIARGMGIAPAALLYKINEAIRAPLPTIRVEGAPVQQNVIKAPFSLADHLPLMTHNGKDSAPYIVSGIMVIRDESGEKLYTSIRRMQYLGENRCTVSVGSADLNERLRRHAEQKKPLDIAVMFGVIPAVTLASQICTDLYHVSKLDVAGALMGQSLPIVRCKTVDVDVLADAEFVLEGRILPWLTEPEGPFGEVGGYYGTAGEKPVVEFTALTHRDNPIFQALMPGSREETLPTFIAREALVYSTVRQTVPGLLNVHVTPGGVGAHVVLQIKKRLPSDGKQAALSAFASHIETKHVVVVDDDVDPFDMEEVEWAVATRVQADLDTFVISGAAGCRLEASFTLRGVSAKLGIDATKPLDNPAFDRTRVPGEDNVKLEALL